ncbi:MAG: DUF3786 domain-containing protein [Desulfobacterales bacterium]
MPPKSEVFEQTCQSYLRQLSEIDGRARAEIIGAEIAGKELIIPFYGKPHRVSCSGVTDSEGRQSAFSICVVLCKYVLMCPPAVPAEGEWVTYLDMESLAIAGTFLSGVLIKQMGG